MSGECFFFFIWKQGISRWAHLQFFTVFTLSDLIDKNILQHFNLVFLTSLGLLVGINYYRSYNHYSKIMLFFTLLPDGSFLSFRLQNRTLDLILLRINDTLTCRLKKHLNTLQRQASVPLGLWFYMGKFSLCCHLTANVFAMNWNIMS